MALADGYLFHVVARLGVEADVPALIMGEFGFDTDTQTLRVGNDTPRPTKIPTDRSTTEFDFTRASKFTLPGGIVFDKAKPGAVGGINLTQFNQANGLLVRRGDNTFGSTVLRSSDQSLIVIGGGGTQGTIDLRINPDSDIIQRLFNGIGTLRISSIAGLQDVLDQIWAAITTARDGAIAAVRGNVPADYNTLGKLYELINTNVVVIGDPSGVVAQVLNIIRDGVATERNTLKKLSDVVDAMDVRLTALINTSTGQDNDPLFRGLVLSQAATDSQILGLTDRMNKELGYYG